MAEVQTQGPEVAHPWNITFLKSKRGLLKIGQGVTLFIAFICFCVAFKPKYIVATGLEFLISFFLLLLYGLKLNQMLTFFMWPLVDVFNSIFAATYLIVLFLLAVSNTVIIAALVGGVVGIISGLLLCVDGSLLYKNITFNRLRGAGQQAPTTTAAPPAPAPTPDEQPQQINSVNPE